MEMQPNIDDILRITEDKLKHTRRKLVEAEREAALPFRRRLIWPAAWVVVSLGFTALFVLGVVRGTGPEVWGVDLVIAFASALAAVARFLEARNVHRDAPDRLAAARDEVAYQEAEIERLKPHENEQERYL